MSDDLGTAFRRLAGEVGAFSAEAFGRHGDARAIREAARMNTRTEFTYTETRELTDSQHRMWAGPLADPEDTIGIIVTDIRRDGPTTTDIAIPKRSIPHLIAFLQEQIDD